MLLDTHEPGEFPGPHYRSYMGGGPQCGLELGWVPTQTTKILYNRRLRTYVVEQTCYLLVAQFLDLRLEDLGSVPSRHGAP